MDSGGAFARLEARFPAWEQAAHAPAREIEDAIRCGGLTRQNARRIKEILNAVDERGGRVDRSRLHDLDDRVAHLALTRHGRTVCLSRRPCCEPCVLLDLCPYGLATVRHRAGRSAAAASSCSQRRMFFRVMSAMWRIASQVL